MLTGQQTYNINQKQNGRRVFITQLFTRLKVSRLPVLNKKIFTAHSFKLNDFLILFINRLIYYVLEVNKINLSWLKRRTNCHQ
jgi:hypothetical protein